MAASKDGDSFILVPSNWKGAKTNGSAAGAFGTATYRLLVRLPAPGRLSLRLGDVGTACSLYADGRLVGEVGRLGATAGTDLPDARVAYFEIEAAKTELELVLDVSSFEDSNGGGIWETPILGLPESIATLKNRHIAIEAFTSGILFSIALFYFAVFLFRRNDHALLLFAMICLCFVARQADTGERLLRLTLPGLAWLIAFRIEYLCICLPVLLYSFFFRSMFPEEYDRRLMRVLAPIGIVFSTAVIVLPPLYFTAILRFIQLYALLVIACVLYALARAAVRRREGALLFIAGIVVLFVSVLNDILMADYSLATIALIPVGQVAFILFQAVALSRRFARDYRRAEDLAEWNNRLRELDEAKTVFFANSSHELRTPVTLITAPLDAIMAGRYGDDIPRNASILALVKRNADRLRRLADGLLDFLRLDAGAAVPRLAAFDLGEIARAYSADFGPLADRSGLSLSFTNEGAAVALVDPALLETVLLNLLSNAMKFTPRGGRVEVSSGCVGGAAWIEVTDTGIGIEPERLQHLFERYAAAGERHRSDYSGFGIGLPLAHGLVRLMGGSIEVRSAQGEGSTFRVAFPAYAGAAGIAPRPASERIAAFASALQEVPAHDAADGARGPAILVVDDDRDMAAFLASALSHRFRVSAAHSGTEALALIAAGLHPRAIVADVMMPGMDGLELRSKVAQLDSCAGVPFIFLSAKVDFATRMEALEAGAVDYVAKPFIIEELEAKLEALVALYEAERDKLVRKVSAVLRDDEHPLADPVATDWKTRAEVIGFAQRDIVIVELVAAGLSDKEIAGSLGLSPRTVSNRVSALLRKVGAGNRAGLVAALATPRGRDRTTSARG